MDDFFKTLLYRAETMSDDQLIFIFVPELLSMLNEYKDKGNEERSEQIRKVLVKIKGRIDLESFAILPEVENALLKIPNPNEIINGKSPKGLPNN